MGIAGPRRRPALVVVEGPNGAGKTTVVQGVATTLGMTPLGFPADFLRYRDDLGLEAEVGPLARLLYHLAAVAQLSDQVLAAGCAVVCDRYWASPVAALEAEGALPEAVVDRVALPVLERLAHPDLTVLLTARPEVLAARIRDRGRVRSSASAAGVVSSPVYAARWVRRLQVRSAQCGPVVEIDTTAMDAPAVVDVAVRQVSDRMGRSLSPV